MGRTFNPVTKQDIKTLPIDHLINQEQEEAIKKAKQRAKQKRSQNPFPVEAFPEPLQEVIRDYHDAYRLPIDYHGTSILVAACTAIGNAYIAHYKRGQAYPVMIWGAIVGYASSGKSPAIDFGLWPLKEIEKKYRDDYEELLIEHRKRKAEEYAQTGKFIEMPEPKGKDVIIGDATVEAINQSLTNNPKGLILVQDELLGWINSMNAYRKGGDKEYFISTWSGKFVKVNRTGRQTMYIPHPFLSAIGGIQPGKLLALAAGGNVDNGMIARFLFAWPDDMKKPEESNSEPKQDHFELYQRVINFIHELPNDFQEPEQAHKMTKINRVQVPLSEEAFKTYVDFLNDYTRQMNNTEDEQIKSTLGKLQQYCLRISLIMEMLDLACKRDPKFGDADWIDTCEEIDLEYMQSLKISKRSMERSIQLIEYYKHTGLRVIQRLESPLKALSHFQQIWYESLPEEFKTKQGIDLGEAISNENGEAKLSRKTLCRILNNRRLFTKKGRGIYEKTILS